MDLLHEVQVVPGARAAVAGDRDVLTRGRRGDTAELVEHAAVGLDRGLAGRAVLADAGDLPVGTDAAADAGEDRVGVLIVGCRTNDGATRRRVRHVELEDRGPGRRAVPCREHHVGAVLELAGEPARAAEPQPALPLVVALHPVVGRAADRLRVGSDAGDPADHVLDVGPIGRRAGSRDQLEQDLVAVECRGPHRPVVKGGPVVPLHALVELAGQAEVGALRQVRPLPESQLEPAGVGDADGLREDDARCRGRVREVARVDARAAELVRRGDGAGGELRGERGGYQGATAHREEEESMHGRSLGRGAARPG